MCTCAGACWAAETQRGNQLLHALLTSSIHLDVKQLTEILAAMTRVGVGPLRYLLCSMCLRIENQILLRSAMNASVSG